MADQDLTQLLESTAAAQNDLLYLVKSTALIDSKITVGNLLLNTAPLDHQHTTAEIPNLFGSALPFSDGAGIVGTSPSAARADHVHPANVDNVVPAELGVTPHAGVSTVYARRDHVHPRPNATDVGAVPLSRNVSAGLGLSGGGDLSANRTLELDILGLPEDSSPVSNGDYVVVGNSVEGHRRVRLDQMPGGNAPNAWNEIRVGSVTLTPSAGANTLTLQAGANVALSANATTDTITIAATGGGGAGGNAFGVIRASGQSDINADAGSDVLTFAGTGIATVSNDPATSTVTVNVPAPVYPMAFGGISVKQGASVSSLEADSFSDMLTLEAGSNITLAMDATGDKITISAVQATVPNIFGHVKVSGNTTDIIPTGENDTLTFIAGQNITLTPNSSARTLTIAATGAGGSATLGGLTDVDDAVSSAGDGARLEYDSGTSRWVSVTDTTLPIPLNNFLIGDASSNAIAASPEMARAAMADICTAVVSRFNAGTISGSLYRDIFNNTEYPIKIIAFSISAAGSGSFRLLTGTVSTTSSALTPVTWNDNTTVKSTPTVQTRYAVQQNEGFLVPPRSRVVFELVSGTNIVDLRYDLYYVRAG